MNGSFVYLFPAVPAAEIYPDASRLTLCSFFARILNNRYIAFRAFLTFALSFYGRVSAIAFDILCKNSCEKCIKYAAASLKTRPCTLIHLFFHSIL